MNVILGCGYTGTRVARLLLARGETVVATTRHPETLHLPGARIVRPEALREAIEPGARVLYSIPVEDARTAPDMIPALAGRAARVVYLSTTGVYGERHDVDETTPPSPQTERHRMRLDEERDLAAGPWSCLILRPAAIYGPGRGVQVSLREGRHRLLGDGSNYVSRIHVDDLAAIAAAALASELTGTYPVADEHPCPAIEITRYCADLLNLPMPAPGEPLAWDDTRRADRRVDGSAIRRALGIRLSYPTYRQGIPAAL